MDSDREYQLLGEGGFGVVFRSAKWDRPGQQVARKLFQKQQARNNEFAISSQAIHKNIVKTVKSGNLEQSDKMAAHGRWYIEYIFIDGLTLLNLMNDEERLAAHIPTERTLLQYIRGGLEGLKYLHNTLKVAHYDIKGENLMITKTELIIIDLGLAKKRPPEYSDEYRGTLGCQPPEYWLEGQCNAYSADIYAYGVIFYELLTGQQLVLPTSIAKNELELMFSTKNPATYEDHKRRLVEEMKKTIETFSSTTDQSNSGLHFTARGHITDLINMMITADHHNRLSASSLLKISSFAADTKSKSTQTSYDVEGPSTKTADGCAGTSNSVQQHDAQVKKMDTLYAESVREIENVKNTLLQRDNELANLNEQLLNQNIALDASKHYADQLKEDLQNAKSTELVRTSDLQGRLLHELTTKLTAESNLEKAESTIQALRAELEAANLQVQKYKDNAAIISIKPTTEMVTTSGTADNTTTRPKSPQAAETNASSILDLAVSGLGLEGEVNQIVHESLSFADVIADFVASNAQPIVTNEARNNNANIMEPEAKRLRTDGGPQSIAELYPTSQLTNIRPEWVSRIVRLSGAQKVESTWWHALDWAWECIYKTDYSGGAAMPTIPNGVYDAQNPYDSKDLKNFSVWAASACWAIQAETNGMVTCRALWAKATGRKEHRFIENLDPALKMQSAKKQHHK